MSSTIPQAELAQLDLTLAAGALVLTPNYSSSMQLQNNWCKYQLARTTSKVIATPAIFAIDLWLGKLWQELALTIAAPQLGWQVLEPAQELILWRQVIRATDEGVLLLNIDGTAASTREALRLLQQWQLDLAEVAEHVGSIADLHTTPDDRAVFLRWAAAFGAQCRARQLLTFSDMLNVILGLTHTHADELAALLPRQLILWDFTDPPPLYQTLFTRFGALGIDVLAWEAALASPEVSIVTCTTEDEECRAAVNWAKDILDANPGATIGLVCADMQGVAPRLARMLGQTFSASVPDPLYSCPLNDNLVAQPFIATALQLLELDERQCDTLVLCQLLRSPWITGAEEEADARAALELQLRRRGELMTSMATFRETCLQVEKPWHCPLLGAVLLQGTHQAAQTASAWLRASQRQWLALLDEKRLLASGNASLAHAWHKLQADMQKLLILFGPATLSETRSLFRRLAQETRLPSASSNAPVQVAGPLASAGMRFTHLWCMQMTEQHWPGAEQHNPWLPLTLQKAAGFPGSSPELLLRKAAQLLQQLSASTSTEVIFSHAQQAQESAVRPSALLSADLPRRSVQIELPALHPAVHLFAPVQELLHDSAPLPLPPGAQYSGSGSVVADQAACPFRAFALHRLKVRELPGLHYGLSANAVGECIHDALQNFWKVIQNSMCLHRADDAELTEHIKAAVTTALRTVARRYPHTMTPRYQELEQERLEKLLLAWLHAERQRGNFSVLANEEKFAWHFANLTLNLRIDRIDRNDDGTVTVIDYKTGQKTPTAWQETRPEKPQLLLYQSAVDAHNQHGPVNALLFAHVNLKEQIYAGIGGSDAALPGIDFLTHKSVTLPSWELLKQHWQDSLQQLAQEYLDGRWVVAPLSRTTCDYCHLDSFCRISERRLFS